MKYKVILIFLFLINCGVSTFLKAQQVNTLYFMEDIPVRHFLNPSFQPTAGFYVSLPIVGFTQLNMGNNSFSLKDLIYKDANSQTVSFLSPTGNIPHFYNTLKSNILINTDVQTNLLSVGFRDESAYWTFSLTEKIESSVNLPKELFQISLLGTLSSISNSYDFSKLDGKVSLYSEAAMGYSKQVNDKWVIGGKLKLLVGSANLTNSNNQIMLNAGVEKWTLKGEGDVNYSGPVKINTTNNYQSYTYSSPTKFADWIHPSGVGAGIDLGFEYRLNEKVKLSGAINDLGFIRWTKNAHKYTYGVDYTFNGIKSFDNDVSTNAFQDVYNQLVTNNDLVDSVVTAFNSSTGYKVVQDSYTTYTTAKINLGFEYSLIKDKLSFGLLSYSQLYKNNMLEEFTGSINARPLSWLNATVSYSLFSGRMSSIGAGLGLTTGIFHWFLAADYIPFEKSTLKLSDLNADYPQTKIPIPYNTKSLTASIGLNLVFNKIEKTNRGLVGMR